MIDRFLGSFRGQVVVALILIAILALVLATYQIRHGAPVCARPSVPLRQLDPELNADGCATIGEERQMHGVWIDTHKGPLYVPEATSVTPAQVKKADGWLMIDPGTRDAIARALPQAGGNVAYQEVAISFIGTDFILDRAVRDGLRRLYDVREIRSVRLLRREYDSARNGPKPTHVVHYGP